MAIRAGQYLRFEYFDKYSENLGKEEYFLDFIDQQFPAEMGLKNSIL